MKIESAAGEFGFEIERVELREDGIALIGRMGVWEAEATVSGADLRRMMAMALKRPGAWGYLLGQLLRARREARK